jgi:hypothetical protein
MSFIKILFLLPKVIQRGKHPNQKPLSVTLVYHFPEMDLRKGNIRKREEEACKVLLVQLNEITKLSKMCGDFVTSPIG